MPGGSLSGRPPPLYDKERAVRILLECILVISSLHCKIHLTNNPISGFFWSCRSVYRRQDVCVAKVILWILTSCTYWWENRYPPIVG